MALTQPEKTLIRQILKYYSGEIHGLPEDDTKIQALIAADEAGKRVLIKQYLENIVLPQEQVNLVNLQNAVTACQNRITQIQSYIAS